MKRFIAYAMQLLLIVPCTLLYGDDAVMLHRYFWANYNHFAGNTHKAGEWYNLIFSEKPSDYSYKGYIAFLFDTKKYNEIVNLIPLIDSKFQKDPDTQLLFILALEQCNKKDEAATRLIEVNNSFKSHSQITAKTVQLYVQKKEPENALMVIDNFLNSSVSRSNSFIFYFLKAQIYVQLNNLTAALKNISTCLEMHPRFDKGWLLFATLQEQMGQLEQSARGYATFLDLAHNSIIEQHLFSLLIQHKDHNEFDQFHHSYFNKAVHFFENKQYRESLRLVNKFLFLHPNNEDAIILKIKIFSATHSINKIVQLIDSLIAYKYYDAESAIWPEIIYSLQYTHAPKNQIFTLFNMLNKKYPKNLWALLYNADLSLKQNLKNNARTLFSQALSLIENDRLKARVYLHIALIDYEQDNYEGMLENLEHGYALDSSCSYINNALAYYFATKGRDLEKAQSFFNAINPELQNTNPAIQDTHAVILYKQQKYAEAEKLLTAVSPAARSCTMNLHLTKIYLKQENKARAETVLSQINIKELTPQEKNRLAALQKKYVL